MIKEYRTLLPLLRRYRGHYFWGVIALVVTSGGQLVLPQYVRLAVDELVGGSAVVARIGSLMLQMMAVALIIALARFGWRYFIHGASRRIESELREKLYNHLLTLAPAYFNQTKTGELMARFTNDMQAIRMAVGMALVAFIDGVFMTIAILAILIAQNARLALFTVLPLPFITLMILGLGSRVGRMFREVQQGFSLLTDQAQEVISGIRVVKSFVKEHYFVTRFGAANLEYQKRNMRLVRVWGVFFPVVGFLSGTTVLILLLAGAPAIIRGELSAGEFVATLSYLQMLTWPMLGAGMTVNMLQRGAASLGRINEVLDTASTIVSPADPYVPVPPYRIELRNLTVRYPNAAADALHGVSCTIEPGQFVGIMGRTGSGKSTLVQALLRLIELPKGAVFINQHDVHDLELDRLRTLFAYVPQSAFLFSATIEQNIAFGLPAADRAAIHDAGTVAAIDGDLKEFVNGWETFVGERGITLSGGQKQRITVARALIVDAPILILDDSLSAVDTKTEERVLHGLRERRRGRTTICITNRVSTIESADQILVLADGAIAQRGTHRQLVRKEGLYREIYDLQRAERAKEHST